MSKRIPILPFLVLFMALVSCKASAQQYTTTNKKAIKLFEEGYQLGMERKDDEALKKLQQAVEVDPDFGEPYQIMGQIYQERKELKPAIESYLKAITVNKERFSVCYSFIGDIYFQTFLFEEAALAYSNYLQYGRMKEETRLVIEKRLEQCNVAADLMRHPVPFEPVNLGSHINSANSEYHPSLTADGALLIYTVREPMQSMNCPSNDGTLEDFYLSEKVNEQWQPRTNAGSPLNSDCNEGAANLSPDGRYLFFAASNRERDQVQYSSVDLYYSEKEGDRWKKPMNLGAPVNTDAFESQPSFSSDGKTLYFTSTRPGGLGGQDIWMTVRNENGSWSDPQNLGPSINTPGDEISPFIHPDNQTLYFCSNGVLGMGGFDFFVARKKADGNFDVATNLGYPINTPFDERSLVISADGSTGYFASTNIKGYGQYDLYMFEMPVASRPHVVTYLKGSIYDKETKKPIEAEFELIDVSNGQVVVKSSSDKVNGEFLVSIPTDKQYALNVGKEGYGIYSQSFEVLGDHSILKPYLVDIALDPLKVDVNFVLRNIFFDTDKYDLKKESYAELGNLIQLLNTNPKMKIEISGHTDNQGSKSHNQVLSENRAKAVYDYLVAHGISASRLTYKGYGDTKPIDDNATEQGRANNRRTEVKITAM